MISYFKTSFNISCILNRNLNGKEKKLFTSNLNIMLGIGWVDSSRSSRFIYKIVNTLQASPLSIFEILFHKSPFELILHSITQTF